METKTFPSAVKDIEGNTVVGIASVFGNKDSHGDIMHSGAFTKTISERSHRFRFLWQHDYWEPPIAKVVVIQEVGRDALPAEILARDTDNQITGGLEVTRKYLNTPRGLEVLEGIKEGAITEMSFAFDVIKSDFGDANETSQKVRHVREVRLWEASDVNWGSNPATLGAKDIGLAHMRHSLKDVMALLELLNSDVGQALTTINNHTTPQNAESSPLSLTELERRSLDLRIELAHLLEVQP
jgi:HK97 family phage prohead protease